MPGDASDHPSSRNSRRRRSGGRFDKAADTDRGRETVDRGRETGDRGQTDGGAPSAVQQFRGVLRRPPIHPLERALFCVVSAHMVMLPWALGTDRPATQFCSLGLAVIGFVLALVPRGADSKAEKLKTEMLKLADAGGTPALPGRSPALASSLSPLASRPPLASFPIFWLGLALLGLILIQALNPAWLYMTDGKVWWMRAVDHVRWLPTGVEVPFSGVPRTAQGGPWRMLLIYSSAWLTVCSVWLGFTRRRTLQWFFVVVAANGLAVGLLGLAQRALGASEIFGIIATPDPSFFATFHYKNHAGGYLLLPLAVAVGLGAWYYARAVRRLDKSSPAGLFAFFVTCIAVAVLLSHARGATLAMLAYLTLVVIGFTAFQWRLPSAARNPVITIALLVVFGLFLKTGLSASNTGFAWDRLRHALSGQDVSVEARRTANRASAEMLAEHWASGVGSGGFPFLYPKHVQKYPTIGVNRFWPHAHNDILEIPIELGIPGVLLLVAGFAYWGLLLVRNYGWQNPFTASLVAGLLVMVAMSWGDFYFYCPAILITWCALWPAVARWTVLEEAKN